MIGMSTIRLFLRNKANGRLHLEGFDTKSSWKARQLWGSNVEFWKARLMLARLQVFVNVH